MIQAQHFPISVSTLWPSGAVELDLFVRNSVDGTYQLYRAAEYPLTIDDLENLRLRKVNTLYVSAESRGRYQHYLRRIVHERDAQENVPIQVQVGALTEVVRDVLEETFQLRNADRCVKATAQLGEATTRILNDDRFTAGELFRVLHHDYATFTHSANVGLYAGMLAKALQWDVGDIGAVVVGALLHDLGKLEIDDRILSKPGRLNEDEMNEIRRHPTIGFRQLAHRGDLRSGQLLMVYQHHERLDGKGYPVGIPGDEIHPWARLCAVVDVFEALTSHRPYRAPLSRHGALKLMEKDSGTAFDPEMLACWTKIIREHYPT